MWVTKIETGAKYLLGDKLLSEYNQYNQEALELDPEIKRGCFLLIYTVSPLTSRDVVQMLFPSRLKTLHNNL